ncbi:MAG: hypothetical protein ACUVQG_09880 [Thermogutta sp.]
MDRFLVLQTGDLYLDRPIRVCGGLPPHLAARVLEGPRETLKRIARLAVTENVDLVIFSGNMIDCSRASAADLDVFAAVCEGLGKSEIPVLWLMGEAEDQGPWPGELPLPNSVHVFSGQEVEQRQVATRKGPVEVIGCPAPCPWDTGREALLPHKPGQLVIGLSRGRGVEELPHVIGVNYWVIIGKYRKTETLGQAIIHSAGPPLTRDFASESLPTVTLTEWDTLRRTSLRELSVGAVRHAVITLLLSADTQWAGLSSQLVQEVESRRASSNADWLIQIKLQGPADVLVRWKRDQVEGQLLQFVRSRYMQEPPYVWPTEIISDPLDFGPEEWLKENSFRGEFFREIGKTYQAVLEKNVDPEVRELLVESDQDDVENGPQSWEELIRQVAFQGLDLLADLAS